MSYVVIPSFAVPSENVEAFLAAAREDAERSLADEEGCLQFDVVLDRSKTPANVVFYEVYRDKNAFDAHLETPHLIAFRAALDLCKEGPVHTFERVVP